MKEELQQKLYDSYPKIFRQKDLPATETCMCWGIACEDGWYTILDTLCREIQFHIDKRYGYDNTVRQVEAEQIKEKFGGLRFYYSGGDNGIEGMVRLAEALSYKTCEWCGNPGETQKKGWIITLCQPCNNTYEEKRSARWKKALEEKNES